MTPAGLVGLLDWIAQEVSPEVQLSTLRAFIFVATRGKCTQKDVELHLGTTGASASRNISYWTERRFDREPGMGFIRREEDEFDRRIKSLTLTKSGLAFYSKLKEKIDGASKR